MCLNKPSNGLGDTIQSHLWAVLGLRIEDHNIFRWFVWFPPKRHVWITVLMDSITWSPTRYVKDQHNIFCRNYPAWSKSESIRCYCNQHESIVVSSGRRRSPIIGEYFDRLFSVIYHIIIFLSNIKWLPVSYSDHGRVF